MRRRLRRVWARALAACSLYLLLALAVPPLIRRAGPPHDQRRAEGPEYVLPSGERVRAAVVTRPDALRAEDRRGERALRWWCGLLAVVTLAGATARTISLRAEAARGAE